MTRTFASRILGLLTAATLSASAAEASVSSNLLSLTGNKRVKLAWQRHTGDGGDIHGSSGGFKLIGFDTATGGEFEIISSLGDYTKPVFNTDGTQLVFTDRSTYKVYKIAFAASQTPTYICDGFATDVWKDGGGVEWIYVREGGASNNNDVYRYKLSDGSRDDSVVWGSTLVGHAIYNWFQLSEDGERAADGFPQGSAMGWVDLNAGSNDPSGSVHSVGGGCWSGMSPDNSYRFWVFDGAHHGVNVYDAGNQYLGNANLWSAAGMSEGETYHPKWSSHPQYGTFDGPFPDGLGGSRRVEAEVWFFKFNGSYDGVAGCVRVTNNGYGEYFPDAWIDDAAQPTVSIDQFTASPTSITLGASSTLTWQTSNATSVSITGGVASTALDGSATVSPTSTTTYTLTADGYGGPKTSSVTITVAAPDDASIDAFTATPSTITQGASSTLAWQTSNASSVSISGVGNVSDDGSTTVSPSDTTTYTITVLGPGGPFTQDVTVTVLSADALHLKLDCGTNSPVAGWEAANAYVTDGSDYGSLPTPGNLGAVSSPAPSAAYNTCRHGSDHAYEIPVPSGTYTVRIHFNDHTDDNRDMTYRIEGATVLNGYDPPNQAEVKEFPGIDVVDTGLTIEAIKGAGNDVFECAIEVIADGAQPAEPITIISPAAGDVWYVGTTRVVRWQVNGLTDGRILYSTDDGGNWDVLLESTNTAEATWLNCPWVVPAEPSTQCIVLVGDYFQTTTKQSATFTIAAVSDGDGDGMDDGWETDTFGDTSHDETTDADGDGVSDYDEFMNGTDPLVDEADSGGGNGLSCAAGSGSSPVACALLACAFLALWPGRRRAMTWYVVNREDR